MVTLLCYVYFKVQQMTVNSLLLNNKDIVFDFILV